MPPPRASSSEEAGFQKVKEKPKSKTLTTKRSQSELRPKVSRPVDLKRAATSTHSFSSDEVIKIKSQSKDKKDKDKEKQGKVGTSLDIVAAAAETDLDESPEPVPKQMQPVDIKSKDSQLKPKTLNGVANGSTNKVNISPVKKSVDLASTTGKPGNVRKVGSRYGMGSKKLSIDIDETKEMDFVQSNVKLQLTEEEKSAAILYDNLAKDIYNNGGYKTTNSEGKLPSRGPYTCGNKMSRGTNFTKQFKHFVETGGIAKYKNCVVMNIRLNDIRDIYSANGSGTFKVNFFLDTAFWTPIWDKVHYSTQETVGKFTQYEPLIQFPEVDVDNGMLRWGLRTAEFSKDTGKSRHHEVQIGQTFDSYVMSDSAGLMNGNIGKPSHSAANAKHSASKVKKVSVVDDCSHWPRLWRVCVTDSELKEIKRLDSHTKRLFEPTNENPKKCHERLTDMFNRLDLARESNLSHPTEGIGFVTYEISCTHRCEFALHEFPFDMHSLKIVVRVDKMDRDPLQRVIVPLGHDKSFFISSRVSELVDYHLARNLDWEVSKEPVSLGGNQRLNASAIVRRKPGYYIRNYVVIIFLLSSSSFTSFIARPDDYETRSMIIFTLLLSVVAFKYSGDDLLPSVSYPTTLDAYILLNFYIVLCVGMASFAFATVCGMSGVRSSNPRKVETDLLCSEEPGRWYGMPWFPRYDPVFETSVGVFLFILWISANVYYWLKVYNRILFNVSIINQVDLGWMQHKHQGGGKKGHYKSEDLVTHKRR